MLGKKTTANLRIPKNEFFSLLVNKIHTVEINVNVTKTIQKYLKIQPLAFILAALIFLTTLQTI